MTVDAAVAAVAVSLQPAVVITADPADLRLLTDGWDVRILPLADRHPDPPDRRAEVSATERAHQAAALQQETTTPPIECLS